MKRVTLSGPDKAFVVTIDGEKVRLKRDQPVELPNDAAKDVASAAKRYDLKLTVEDVESASKSQKKAADDGEDNGAS